MFPELLALIIVAAKLQRFYFKDFIVVNFDFQERVQFDYSLTTFVQTDGFPPAT